MNLSEQRLVDDAIYQLNAGYALGALAILRALQEAQPPRATCTVPRMTRQE